ncbi:MAG: hypothetical protein ACRDNF_11525 [Streptosporangiaceae bacterium]
MAAAAKDRAKRMRALAAVLQAECGVVTETSYDGRAWVVSWSNGPVTMRGVVATQAPQLGLDPDAIRLCRLVQDNAMPVQAIRLGRAGQLPLSGRPAAVARAIELAAEQADYPERPADDTEAALAGRLAAETAAQPDTRWVDADSIAELICRQGGIGWLLAPLDSTPNGLATALNSLDAALAMLTAAYASGQAKQNWVERGSLMDAASALAAVRADPAPATKAACAGLTVLRGELKKLERAELDLLDAARGAGGTWVQIATALAAGTRQAAYKRHRDLTSRHQHLRARVNH